MRIVSSPGEVFSLIEGLLMGDPVIMAILHPKNFVARGPEDW